MAIYFQKKVSLITVLHLIHLTLMSVSKGCDGQKDLNTCLFRKIKVHVHVMNIKYKIAYLP